MLNKIAALATNIVLFFLGSVEKTNCEKQMQDINY